jgi:hypothetical protein
MRTVQSVARKIEQEVGLPHATALRISRKLNDLARSVSWATPLPDEAERKKKIRPAAKPPRARGVEKAIPKKK